MEEVYPSWAHKERSWCDPSLAWDANGNVYECGLAGCLAQTNAGCTFGTILHRSTDNGKSWSVFDTLSYINLQDTSFDEPFLFIDRNGTSPYMNSMYAFYVEQIYNTLLGYVPNGIKLQIRRSNGTGFSVHTPVSQIALAQFPHAAFGLHGEIYVIYVGITNLATLAGGVYFNASTDGGETFTPDKVLFTGDYPDSINGFPKQGQLNNSRVSPTPTIVVDTSQSPYRGNIYISYAMPNPTSPASGLDIFLQRSTDGGNTWSDPLRVNDDPLGNGADQMQPSMAISPSGAIGVMFYDRRDDPDNLLMNTYIALSTDGGNTFLNQQITTQQTNPLVGRLYNGMAVADYCGITATPTAFMPVWSDGRTNDGYLNIYTSRVPVQSATAVREPAESPAAALAIYPNPVATNSMLCYTLSEETNVVITLTNALGEHIATLCSGTQSAGVHQKSVDFSSLNSGMFFCTMKTQNDVEVEKVFVVK